MLEFWLLWVDGVQTAQLVWLSSMGTLLREPVIGWGDGALKVAPCNVGTRHH
jgi:hypothetical protein